MAIYAHSLEYAEHSIFEGMGINSIARGLRCSGTNNRVSAYNDVHSEFFS